MIDNYEDIVDVIQAVQEGDIEIVAQAIDMRLVSANATDKDGCTLLHWAAINNRRAIAAFLIDSCGVDNVGGGGVLNENPLQWAIRKKYYAMAELLHSKHVCSIAHKSVQGLDALHLACKLGGY